MPKRDGFEATRRIRQLPEGASTPIVAMTAHAMSGDREKSLFAGMNDHITKPIDHDHLYSILGKWIRPGRKRFLEVDTGKAKRTDSSEDRFNLPDSLPGIDMKGGVQRVDGNMALYRTILLSFRDNHSRVVRRNGRQWPPEMLKMPCGWPIRLKGSTPRPRIICGN